MNVRYNESQVQPSAHDQSAAPTEILSVVDLTSAPIGRQGVSGFGGLLCEHPVEGSVWKSACAANMFKKVLSTGGFYPLSAALK